MQIVLFLSVFLLAALCLLFSLIPHVSYSLVSDLVKCSRTAAWRVPVQLINNSDNMIYVIQYTLHIRSLSVIASQMYFVHASFSVSAKKRKKKGSGLEGWVHYPGHCTHQWTGLTEILENDATVVNFHLSLFANGIKSKGVMQFSAFLEHCFHSYCMQSQQQILVKAITC